jgi:hypothetical protein
MQAGNLGFGLHCISFSFASEKRVRQCKPDAHAHTGLNHICVKANAEHCQISFGGFIQLYG